MKIRKGFVSNSSSSSFVLDKDGMTVEQLEEFRKLLYNDEDDTCIFESNKHFHGTVSVHNTEIPEFIKEHGLDADFDM